MKLADFKIWLDGFLAGTTDDKVRATVLAKLATVQPEQVFTGGAIAGWPPGLLPRAPGQQSGGTAPLNDKFWLGGAGVQLCDAHIRPGVLRASDLVTGGITARNISVGRITIPVDITDEFRRLQGLAVDRVRPGSITARSIGELNSRGGK